MDTKEQKLANVSKAKQTSKQKTTEEEAKDANDIFLVQSCGGLYNQKMIQFKPEKKTLRVKVFSPSACSFHGRNFLPALFTDSRCDDDDQTFLFLLCEWQSNVMIMNKSHS